MTYFEPSKALFLRVLLISVILGTVGTLLFLFINPVKTENNSKPFFNEKTVCVIGGCSGELCLSEEDSSGMVSNCLYKDSYACYQKALCTVQSNGICGWTQTPELKACLANPPDLN